MTRKLPLLAVVVVALTFTAFASSVVSRMTSMPEPGTLAILGSGLLGTAFTVRRKLKILARQSATQKHQLSQPPLISQSPFTIDQTAA